jgi:hypothetical protein
MYLSVSRQVIKVDYWSMGKTIYGIFDDNQCVEEIRRTKVEKGYGFRAKIPFLRVSCN